VRMELAGSIQKMIWTESEDVEFENGRLSDPFGNTSIFYALTYGSLQISWNFCDAL
jgi:hypothetical protein